MEDVGKLTPPVSSFTPEDLLFFTLPLTLMLPLCLTVCAQPFGLGVVVWCCFTCLTLKAEISSLNLEVFSWC